MSSVPSEGQDYQSAYLNAQVHMPFLLPDQDAEGLEVCMYMGRKGLGEGYGPWEYSKLVP